VLRSFLTVFSKCDFHPGAPVGENRPKTALRCKKLPDYFS
jgi:hypothetical protein